MRLVVLQALDTFLAMSSMFGYTATLVLIPTLAMIAYLLPWKLPAWGIGMFITGATVAGSHARHAQRCKHVPAWMLNTLHVPMLGHSCAASCLTMCNRSSRVSCKQMQKLQTMMSSHGTL
jgi:hypothetical protein